MKRLAVLFGVLVFLCCGALVPTLVLPLELGFWLTVGWVPFLGRVVPQMTIDWGGLATGVLCLAGLALGLHYFCGWLHGQIMKARYPDQVPATAWQLRWTLSLLFVVVL